MKKCSFGTYLAAVLVVIGIFYIIGAIGKASEPKCIKASKWISGALWMYDSRLYERIPHECCSCYAEKYAGLRDFCC